MRVYTNIKAGLGDILANQFSLLNYIKPNPVSIALARMVHGYLNGTIEEIAIVRDGGNPAAIELFDALGLPQRTREYVDGWTHAIDLKEPTEIQPLSVPTRQPLVAIPKRYILFSEVSGGELERCLNDTEIFKLLHSTGLPIIKVGRDEQREDRPWTDSNVIPSNINLTGKTTLPETAWLAKHAACVVAGLSFHRVWASLFNVPVIELVQEDRINAAIAERTEIEYRDGYYGIAHTGINRWFKWPLQAKEIRELVFEHCKIEIPKPIVEPTITIGELKGLQSDWIIDNSATDTHLMHRQLTNTKPEDFAPDIVTLKQFELDTALPLKIVDFGCGMLRNTAGLLSLSPNWQVTAYDTPIMLERGYKKFGLQSEIRRGRLSLVSSWEHLRAETYDAIICSLVLQHIGAEELKGIVAEFSKMTSKLCVIGRRCLDNGDPVVWHILREYWQPTKVFVCPNVLQSQRGVSRFDLLDTSVLDSGDKEDHHIVIFGAK